MDSKRKTRQRGVVLTARGLQKLQAARREAEIAENAGDRYTLEELSERAGLSIKTVAKVLEARGTVDKPTLEILFRAFQLSLDRADYRYPSAGAPGENAPVEEIPEIPDGALAVSESDGTDRPPAAGIQIDWGEAPDVSRFYGRQEELAHLKRWLVPDGQSRLIAILGMGGIGKTSLATKLLHEAIGGQVAGPPFERVIWRSLRNAPTLEIILEQWIALLSDRRETRPSLPKLLHYLQKYRCLLVLDNWETVLSGVSGRYRPGYESYGELLNLIGETPHRGSLIITSRERTIELNTLAGENFPVRCLTLKGSNEASRYLLSAKGLRGTPEQQRQLCDRYGNSPLAVKIIAATIQDLFDGEIEAFLREDATVFPGIRRLLDGQFDRLSGLERTIMFWLAIDRDWTTIDELALDLLPATPRHKILEALEALHWRDLIEKRKGLYTQQPIVMEYVTESLTEAIGAELLAAPERPAISLHRLAILKTTAKDYVRDSQRCLIVGAIVRELQATLGSNAAIARHLQNQYLSVKDFPGLLAYGIPRVSVSL